MENIFARKKSPNKFKSITTMFRWQIGGYRKKLLWRILKPNFSVGILLAHGWVVCLVVGWRWVLKKGWPVRVTTPQRKDINQIHLRVRRHEGYCCEDVSQKYGAEQVSLWVYTVKFARQEWWAQEPVISHWQVLWWKNDSIVPNNLDKQIFSSRSIKIN